MAETAANPLTYAIIDAARDYSRIALAEHCCVWSESLFSGEKGEELADVAPHLYLCDYEGTVPWLTVRGFNKGEAGILLECNRKFNEVRRMLRRRLAVRREKANRLAYFRFYDPRVLRTFLPACTTQDLKEFFGPIDAFHCQSEDRLKVNSYSLSPTGELVIEKNHIDDFLVAKGYCTQEEMDEAEAELQQLKTQDPS